MSAHHTTASRALPLVAVSAIVAALAWHMADQLPLPDGWSAEATLTWLREQGPVLAAFALVRGVALVVALYGFVLGVIGLLAIVVGSPTLATLAVRITIPPLRPLVAPVAAFTLSMGSPLSAGATGATGASDSAPRPPVMHVAPAPPPDGRGEPVMQLLPAVPMIAPSPSAVGPTQRQDTEASYIVAAGDSFWSIAAEKMQSTMGYEPSDAEVARYWRVLIEANRDRLVVSGEPDLIYPGQLFTLPPVS